MPNMETLTVNGVKYDILDANAVERAYSGGTYNGDFRTAPIGSCWTQVSAGSCSNYPPNANYGILVTYITNNNRHLLYIEYSTGATYYCSSVNGWGDWINIGGNVPNINAETECYTMERFKGRPVYARAINMGAIAAGSVTFDHGIENIDSVVDWSMYNMKTGTNVSCSTRLSSVDVTKTSVNIVSNGSTSDWAVCIIIRYTKTTD